MSPIVPAVCIAAAAIALAQEAAQPTSAPTASITGTVRDASSGKPLPEFKVIAGVKGGKPVTSTTDAQGRYKLSALPPAEYTVIANSPLYVFANATKSVTLAGADVEGVDFRFMVPGKITGKVVDENGDPVPDMTVYLVSREYYLGAVGYFFKDAANTDDRGRYTLARVPGGRPFLVMAEKRAAALPAHSAVPLNPKLRRRVPMRTFYPGSPAREGAAAVTITSGERREGVDIQVRKSPSYCAEGTLETPNGPAALRFSIEAQQPSSGISTTGGMFTRAPSGTTGRDGRFRICDLYPGTYRLTATGSSSDARGLPPNYGTATVTVVDEDLHDLRLVATPGLPFEGEVVWDGVPPEKPVTAKLRFWLQPLLRSNIWGEDNSVRPGIPDTFSLPALLIDDYVLDVSVSAPGLYIKDILYAGRSIRYEPFRPGSAMPGTGLRIIVARDGATLTALVTGKDRNPVPDRNVLLMPAGITSEGMLAAAMVTGQTDQAGRYKSRTLAPGKYYAAATAEPFDVSPGDHRPALESPRPLQGTGTPAQRHGADYTGRDPPRMTAPGTAARALRYDIRRRSRHIRPSEESRASDGEPVCNVIDDPGNARCHRSRHLGPAPAFYQRAAARGLPGRSSRRAARRTPGRRHLDAGIGPGRLAPPA